MSVNYNEQTAMGQTWQRCYDVRITNPLNGTRRIIFEEEKIINIADTQIKQPVGYVDKIFNTEDVVPIVNPETGMLTGGSITHQDLYVYLYSLYLKTAQERDQTATPTQQGTVIASGSPGG